MGERSQLNSFALMPMYVILKCVLNAGGIHALFVAGVQQSSFFYKSRATIKCCSNAITKYFLVRQIHRLLYNNNQ